MAKNGKNMEKFAKICTQKMSQWLSLGPKMVIQIQHCEQTLFYDTSPNSKSKCLKKRDPNSNFKQYNFAHCQIVGKTIVNCL